MDVLRHLVMACLLLRAADTAVGADSALPAPGVFSFAPNQMAGNEWYRPGDPKQVVNGHLDASFGQGAAWTTLARNLAKCGGSFSVYAAEIGYLSSTTGLLPLLKAKGIRLAVEVPGFTQAMDGADLGRMEISGETVGGVDLFAKLFRIQPSAERTDPSGNGWFVTRDGAACIPDELLLDERMPNLLPEFDWAVLAQTHGDWEARKDAARKLKPFAAARQPFARLMSSLMQDYVSYLNVAKARWGARMPAVCLHWNVNPAWEWRDEQGLDAIRTKDPAFFDAPEDFTRILPTAPQYRSVRYLSDLIAVLTAAGFKPRSVFMDVDWTYDLTYVTEVLKRHKAALAPLGVQMGINVVDAGLGEQEELVSAGQTLKVHKDLQAAPNALYERTLIAIMGYLKSSGIFAKGMHIRVGSWSHRPHEVGGRISETTPGSLAHAANALFKLVPVR